MARQPASTIAKATKNKKSKWEEQELVSETKQVFLTNWNTSNCYSDFEAREEFSMLGTKWCLVFKPISSEYDGADGFATIMLSNISEEPITASYCLTMKNQMGLNDDVSFTDPEKFVVFDVQGCGDDGWGTDEFMSTLWLQDDSYGFIQDDAVCLEITINTYANASKSKDSVLMKAIEESKEKDDLLTLADEDIEPFRLKYEMSAAAKLHFQEDTLLRTRCDDISRKEKTNRRKSSAADLLRKTSERSWDVGDL